MENANPFIPTPPIEIRAIITQELNELRTISAMIDSYLENIGHTHIPIPPHASFEQLLDDFMNPPDVFEMDDSESDSEFNDTPLVYPFLDSDEESDDGEVINELNEYGNGWNFYCNRIINSVDGNDLAFPCMIGLMKFFAYFDSFLPMNIITRKAYNTIMVNGLENTGRNLVTIVRDVYVCIGSFTYVMDFILLEDIWEFIVSDIADVLIERPFRTVSQLEYDCVKEWISFTRIFYTYTFRIPRTIPRLTNFDWSKVQPILELSQRDLMGGIRYSHEKNKFMYKTCLNLGLEYHVDESMKEWLIRGHVSVDGVT
nr:protein kinase-like domain, concanavalin A-like lectin/glucanase domain protein [Tanacetum cinerariifolium]